MWKVGPLSIKVKLTLLKQYDVELLRKIPDYGKLIRVIGWIKFKTLFGWTEPSHAIIDSGAHTSLIPLSLWQEIDVKIISDYYVRGLVPKPECKIDVKVGWIEGKIVDEYGNSTPKIKFRAFLALVDNIPLIIGFKDLLEKFLIKINPVANQAFIEIR